MSEHPLNPADIQKDHAIVHFFALLAGVEQIDVRARLLVSGIAFFLRMDAVVLGFRDAETDSCTVYRWHKGTNAEFTGVAADDTSLAFAVARAMDEAGFNTPRKLSLIYQGKVIGYLAVARRESPQLSAEEEFLLTSFQTLTALLLANYRAVIELKQQSARLEVALESERRHEGHLRAILDNLPVGVWFTDADGRILLGNPAAQNLWAGARYVGMPDYGEYKAWWRASGKPVQPGDWAVARALASGVACLNDELDIECFDGTRKSIINSAVPIHDAQGTVIGAVAINQDVTDRLRAQESLMRAEKLASAGRLAASIAHEVNNPLEAVTNLLFLALKDPSLPPLVREYLALADQELQRVTHITKTTLGFYRDSAAPAVVDLADILDQLLALYERKLQAHDIEVRKVYAAGTTACVNAGEIRQLFSNLIANAIDALPNGGKLVVRIAPSHHRKEPALRGIRVVIADDGPGIPRDHRHRIFEAFFTTKKAVGTGLGLWLSKNIVDNHGGTIRVRSVPGVGTAFSIFLPAAAAPLAQKATAGT